jgi:guanosine-3',5'-bis(diphosphate) 3'-pyrophosphohydrolase
MVRDFFKKRRKIDDMETATIKYTEEDIKQIQHDYKKLLQLLDIKNDEDRKNIRMAFELAVEAHQKQRRKSGEPYILHPIEVARICVQEIGLGPTAVISALLHDTVEDTDTTLEDIRNLFGEKIEMIVDGLTKLEKAFDIKSPQAENFKKILQTLTKDVRVVLIKMADRLHNMRTLGAMPKHKQLKIASETAFIYAPLAHRLGLYNMKTEFQDMVMKITDYENYKMIANKLIDTKKQRNSYIDEFIAPIAEELDELGYKYRIMGRPKSISSIWSKIQTKKVPFEQIYDLFAVRIIVDVEQKLEKRACWLVYSVISDIYRPIPERLKDWVSTPKSNGYESLHTTVMGLSGRFVEVQVRTERMDEIAEKGFAAHWKYKKMYSENVFDHWINSMREILDNPSDDALEFIADFKANLFSEEIYVYTPKGDMKILPLGATPLDFAFDIHTEIGYRCASAKVNGRLVPLSYKLANGDKVGINISPNQKPNESWLGMVITTRAKNRIRSAMKEEKRTAGEIGKETLMRKFKSLGAKWDEENLVLLTKKFDLPSFVELYYQISLDKGWLSNLKEFRVDNGLLIEIKKEEERLNRPMISIPKVRRLSTILPKLMINGESAEKYDYTLASCCNPVQGDNIFAYVSAGAGVKIHRMTCPNATNLMATYGYRIMQAEWVSEQSASFVTELKIIGVDEIGVVQKLTNVITNELGVNMRSITMSADDGFYLGKISIVVKNTSKLMSIVKRLKKQTGVTSVTRIY